MLLDRNAEIKKLVTLFILFISLVFNTFAASNSELRNRYLQKAEDAFENEKLEDAYKYVNFALQLDSTDAAVISFSRMIYRKKLEAIIANYDDAALVDIQTNLEKFTNVPDSNIKKLLKQIDNYKEEQKEKARLAEIEAQNKLEEERFQRQQEATKKQNDAMRKTMQKQSDVMKEQTEALKDTMQQQAEVMQQQNEALQQSMNVQSEVMKAQTEVLQKQTEAFSATAQETKKSTKVIAFAVLGIALLIIIIILVVVALVHRGFQQQQMRQDQYMQAFQAIAANQNQTNRLMLGGVTDLYNASSQMRLAGSSTWTPTLSLPDVQISEEDQEEIKVLAVKCEDIGQTIDMISGRKNNSKNVSELVYKISMHLGVPQGMSMLNFCAAMVYDAGFMGLDSELLMSASLTEEQKTAIKEHVNIAEKHLDFVPKKYWSVFEDAAMKHHENMDGSGYPKGLKGDEIPQIARLIRVAESYVSMSSKRSYRDALDKESAIQKLREQPQFYDPAVVDALEAIV